MPRIAVTVEQLWQPLPGGSGTYIEELTAQLTQRSGLGLVGVAARGHVSHPNLAGVPVRSATWPREALYAAWAFARRPRAEQLAGDVDVVHATTWAVPGRRAPLVVTVHDLAFLRDPGYFTGWGNRYFRRALRVVLDEADAVIVPSAATASDCYEVGFEPDRVVVVPHGVRVRDVEPSEVLDWRARYRIGGPYVLWCGTLEPRKNVERLVQGFALAREQGLEARLVIVGPDGWGSASQRVAAASAGLPVDAVAVLGRLSADDLQVAYSGAAAFAFPSLWEGFGMPVLEAMAHGVPVVTSAGTAMAEFAAGCGALVDPHSVESIAAGLVATVEHGDAGAIRAAAAGHTWAASAAEHVRVYERVAR